MRSTAIGKVLLVVGVLAMAVPLAAGAQSPAPQDPGVVEVTGTSQGGPCPGAGTVQVVDGVQEHRGTWCSPSWVWSDPRLNGTATWASNEDRYPTGLVIGTWAISFENDEGAWRMRPQHYVEDFVRIGQPALNGFQLVFDGEGAYDGLVAVVVADNRTEPWQLHGFITDKGVPVQPDNASPD